MEGPIPAENSVSELTFIKRVRRYNKRMILRDKFKSKNQIVVNIFKIKYY